MILRNLAHHALVQGNTMRVTSASDILADLATQDASAALTRRLYATRCRAFCALGGHVLCRGHTNHPVRSNVRAGVATSRVAGISRAKSSAWRIAFFSVNALMVPMTDAVGIERVFHSVVDAGHVPAS
ncbi:MAG: family ATPase [Myxococcaceae bacterium]|nr:family ATPase [Myxococcaceae bacterium]